ncbi:RluA family pseudouridine synthase [Ornithobacterium rhinotracheale]|uniref:23S RNA-specific pseudouridylate synthase n=1 Tax=Ornithobacterium rhinotracheale (strain ATCC 51463 / DSM 15997 / CCUG 23171 / CIP 104009 / LMG 9086) TaxID=867902 RepID=I4A0H8_ORNRL|nr:RluA family pseudouridine synthase [Ornithobacterium rhinotracheale]AFL97462.1 23S RNA-specific pseudouridylate synthase [Ornithobacterium rhinotracheale DSM 15997]AIP98994.1 ribosomal large subunit pseudouridine synthase D [Ornithobacterium rhinotracheale ORT-UMN 88]KGB66925.1 ribosomal large subunit pseudouridine synthase D [Ornithobacterium rhinotracheale H06-030791]MBN3661971.1 RluA family pseudouridine synthase [Ornithobacterium rhinotracheale]MCK0195171.1 RluA family pseudouridine syn
MRAPELEFLYEDNHLIIVNKKCGELVQGDKTGDKSLLDDIKDFIKIRDKKPGNVYLGLIHRLDRVTSGAIVYAKTSKALSRMNEKFKSRKVDKTYWALCTPLAPNQPTEGTLTHYLRKNSKNNTVTVFPRPTDGAKKAVLHYKLIKKLDRYWLFEIELETGRSHQIRAQMAKIGAIIKGDLKYGADRSNKDGGIHLHARYLSFEHPVTKEPVSVTAPLPDDNLWNACED